MKNIFRSVVLICLGFGSMAGASVSANITHNDFVFTVNGREDLGATIYYNCDSVESYAMDLLQKMGASNVAVTCSGGNGQLTDFPAVHVEFDSVRIAGSDSGDRAVMADWSPIALHDFDNCQLAHAVVKSVKDHFEISDFSDDRACSRPDGAYRFHFNVLISK